MSHSRYGERPEPRHIVSPYRESVRSARVWFLNMQMRSSRAGTGRNQLCRAWVVADAALACKSCILSLHTVAVGCQLQTHMNTLQRKPHKTLWHSGAFLQLIQNAMVHRNASAACVHTCAAQRLRDAERRSTPDAVESAPVAPAVLPPNGCAAAIIGTQTPTNAPCPAHGRAAEAMLAQDCGTATRDQGCPLGAGSELGP